jgi:Flp pilus assembly protein TadD
MKIMKKLLIIGFILMTACSYNKERPAATKQVVMQKSEKNKVETQAVKKQNTLQLIEKKEIEKVVSKKSPVIIKLMADADESIKQGDFNVAAATLERAVRISPREAEVFNQLAYVRFKQKKWELAEHLAKKSALLAENNNALKKRNWLLIAAIRKQKGDDKGANFAMLKAKKY